MRRVFVCYSKLDCAIATLLADGLETNHLITWLFTRNQRIGQDYTEAIEKEIKSCIAFVVLLTPNSLNSDEVFYEVRTAKNCKKDIIPILAGITYDEAYYSKGSTMRQMATLHFETMDVHNMNITISNVTIILKSIIAKGKKARVKRIIKSIYDVMACLSLLALVGWSLLWVGNNFNRWEETKESKTNNITDVPPDETPKYKFEK